MHTILTIFRKDVRRLRWQIGAMLALSVALGCLEGGRADAKASPVEILLNFVLPLVWACLIAQAVHEDATAGDREFWMTRPCRWRRLLAAKALFAVLFVHAPSLATDAAILAARGFNPLEWLPQLLGKQLLLGVLLTLPAMAVASLVSDLTQFIFAGIVAPVTIFLLANVFWLRHGLRGRSYFFAAAALLALAALTVMLLQYGLRRTGLSRVLAVTGALAAGLLCVPIYPVKPVVAAYQASGPETFRIAPGIRPHMGCVTDRVHVELPIVTTGFPPAQDWGVGSLSLFATGANGEHYDNQPRAYSTPPTAVESKTVEGVRYTRTLTKVENQMFAGWSVGADGSLNALTLSMNRDDYDRLTKGKVTLAGTLGVRVYQAPAVRLRAGERREVPGVGYCSSQAQHGNLIVTCETPAGRPVQARVALELARANGSGTREQILESQSDGQRSTLLSPLRWPTIQFWLGDPWQGAPAGQAVVLVQRISRSDTVDILLPDVTLPDTGRCHPSQQ
jgi:hypothetical protein